jgi:hypothetical protein
MSPAFFKIFAAKQLTSDFKKLIFKIFVQG